MTAIEIFQKLKAIFPSPAHTLLSQVRNGVGLARRERTIDALALSNYPSRGLWMAGIEIKTYLGDWKRELANGDKADAIQRYCQFWYIAAPEGLIPLNELPKTWGLIEVGKKVKIAIKAPLVEAQSIDMLLLCSILRNVMECNTPNEQVADAAQKRSEEIASRDNYELSELRKRVSEFEANSAMKINSYSAGEIGKAVKLVMDAGLNYDLSLLRKLREESKQVMVSCDKIMAVVSKESAACRRD